MTVMRLMTALGTFVLATSTPASAQMAGNQMDHGAMDHGNAMSGHAVKPGKADASKMARCNAMPHADAMKDAGCAAMMKAHPEMMDHKPAEAAKKSM